MFTGVRRGGPVRQQVGYYSRAAKAKRRQERTTGVSYVFHTYIFTDSIANQQLNRPSGDETTCSGGKKTHWTIKDLPQDTDLNKWNVFIVTHFLRHFACYGEPWDANAYLEVAQTLWKKTFPGSKHVLTQNNDAAYPLVCHFRFFFAFWTHFRYILAAP